MEAHRYRLAILSVAALALPFAGLAAALPGDDGDVDLTVDGSVHSQTAEQFQAPAGLSSPAAVPEQSVALRMRTRDVVLPNPAGVAYSAAEPLTPGAARLVRLDGAGAHAGMAGTQAFVPWYYMMDEGSVAPYRALFWDTGTGWYVAWADDEYQTYAFLLPGAPPSPMPAVGELVPDVKLRTAVQDIDVAAGLGLLLGSVAAAEPSTPGWQRGFALDALGASGLSLADPLPGPVAGATAMLDPSAAVPPAPQGAGPLEPFAAALAPSASGFLAAVPAAAAGAMGLLAGVAAYHLIRKSAILKNTVRSAIAEQVLSNPGSTITEIALAVGVTHQTASYHLRLLQEHGLVIGVERGNKRLYFRNDGSFNSEERGLVAVLRDQESMRVLELIRQNPWIMKNEAAAALGVSRNTLNWHLQKLLAAALVSEARENGHCFLFCNKRASVGTLGVVAQKVEERRALGMPAAEGAAQEHAQAAASGATSAARPEGDPFPGA
jgi:DNA-binding transcriptional ArsR family regulator